MGCKTRVIVRPNVTDVVVKDDRPHTISTTPVAKVVRVGSPSPVRRIETRNNVVTQRPVNRVVEVGTPGPQGEPGPPGPAGGSVISYVAGEQTFGLRAVRAEAGLVYHPDLGIVEHAKQTFGIALQSVVPGDEVQVQIGGELTEPSWTWAPGFVYCGTDGQLTQSPPAVGWLLAIGRAVSATTINIDIDTPFVRA